MGSLVTSDLNCLKEIWSLQKKRWQKKLKKSSFLKAVVSNWEYITLKGKNDRLIQSSSSIFFRSTPRERKPSGSPLIVALVSLLSFPEATKCIAFHFNLLDVFTVSILSQLLYESSCLPLVRIPFRDWSVSLNHFAHPRSYRNLNSLR